MAILSACSAEKKTTLSLAFHNTTAHYNSYYYAKVNIRNVREKVNASVNNDFDEILPIFPAIDSNLVKSYTEEIDEAIKMASISIQRHPNSKWVDDSYLLIGLARYYSLDFVNAIQTFKYINTESDDDDTRHKALIYLMRTFTDYGEYENAIAVSDFLKKEKLNKNNQKLLFIYRAYYYQVREDLDNMLSNLVNAAPTLRRKDGRGRMFFIIGQNYQELGFGPEAYNYYKKCIATNPEYELDFYARLNMARVAEIENNSDIEDVRKTFRRLLTDQKNKEFQDKIYYEMAEFELEQGYLDKALDFYKSSVSVSSQNRKQKGKSYLRLGQLYYDSLQNYQKAQAYYDSSLTVLPTDFEGYEKISERSKILTSFVEHLNTITTQDSLLYLASMDSGKLNLLLSEKVKEKQLKIAEAEKVKREKLRQSSYNVFDSGPQTETASWYFGNPSAVAMGKTEFRRIWGDVQLEDDWRRSYRGSQGEFTDVGDTRPDERYIAITPTEEELELEIQSQVEELKKTIPFSSEEQLLANTKIEHAYYQLGNIYYFQLEESAFASESFEKLLSRYDTTEYKPEVMYLLYLIYQDLENPEKVDLYKNKVLNQFPNSNYARLIENPNYTEESSLAAEKLKVLYDSAYAFYKIDSFSLSKNVISSALSDYEDLEISNRFRLLDILITGKNENITQYQFELSEFIKTYPDSEISPYAQQLLDASRSFQDKMKRLSGIKYVEFFEQEHYVVIAYEKGRKNVTNQLSFQINSINKSKFPEKSLNVSNLIMGEDYLLTMISEFPGAKSSMVYYDQLRSNDEIQQILEGFNYQIFSITTDNFSIMYQAKDIDSYLGFFNENY